MVERETFIKDVLIEGFIKSDFIGCLDIKKSLTHYYLMYIILLLSQRLIYRDFINH